MRHAVTVLGLLLGCAAQAASTTLAPFAGYCAVLDRIAAAAGARDQNWPLAIKSLEKIALGHGSDIDAEADAALGFQAGTLEDRAFAEVTPRTCALRSIGRTGLEDAVDFLAKLSPADLGPDLTQTMWPAAQIALRDAQFRRIADPEARIEFLEGILSGARDGRGPVAAWAVDELCNRGAQMSLPVIFKSVRSRGNGQRDEDEIQFCEERIRVILSDQDRVKALSSVLAVANNVVDTRLVGWAVNELQAMQNANADSELERFASEIGTLPETSPDKDSLRIYRQEIIEFQRRRARAK